ncbi:MAG: adenylate kinase family protein [Nitrososphaerota archaeon]|nr:adenylate kinase family protein [Candidatus Aenigmarchaeota archaeon]
MKIYAITGTPGTGKSKVAKLLSKKFAVLNLNKEIKRRKLYKKYDNKRKCFIFDEKKTLKFVKEWIKKQKNDIFIESHVSHLLNLKYDLIFVFRCNPEVLYKRLKRRKWNKEKVQENLEAEIFGIIEEEARRKGKTYIIDTTNKSPERIAGEMLKYIKKES